MLDFLSCVILCDILYRLGCSTLTYTLFLAAVTIGFVEDNGTALANYINRLVLKYRERKGEE